MRTIYRAMSCVSARYRAMSCVSQQLASKHIYIYIYISVYKCAFPDFKKLESGCFVIARICTISRDVVHILAIEKEASQL